MMKASENGIRLDAPSLHPWRESWECPACGFREEYWWRRLLQKMRGKKVKTVANARFCAGNKPPEEELEGFARMLYFGSGKIMHECSGLFMPHLHVKCEHCGVIWFTETKEQL